MKTISIHGKNYVPVSERIKEAGDNLWNVDTEVLQHEPVVVVKAKVRIAMRQGIRQIAGITIYQKDEVSL